MQHLEVLALVGQGLFQVGIVLLEGHVPGPTVRKHLGIVLYMLVEDRPEGFRAIILDYLGVAPAGLTVPVLEGDHHAHLALALAPSLFPGLRGPISNSSTWTSSSNGYCSLLFMAACTFCLNSHAVFWFTPKCSASQMLFAPFLLVAIS